MFLCVLSVLRKKRKRKTGSRPSSQSVSAGQSQGRNNCVAKPVQLQLGVIFCLLVEVEHQSVYINSANSITGPLQSECKKAECVCHTCPVGCSMPVLVVMCETREAGHGARVVVSDPLNHLPHLLPPLLLFEDPGLLVPCDAFPGHTHTHTQNSSCRSKHRRPSNGPTALLCGCRYSNVNDWCCWRLRTGTLIKSTAHLKG